MLLIGLTGGIASGKTVVAREFMQLGAYVIDADKLAHKVMQKGEPAYNNIVECFGERILDTNRCIDRTKLAELVFANEASLDKLNKIVHPLVLEEEKRRIAKIVAQDDKAIIIVDVPLLIEVRHYEDMDKVIVVAATEKKQIQRLLIKGLTEAQAEARIAAQLPLADKLKYADFVIDNNGVLEETYAQVREVFVKLKEM